MKVGDGDLLCEVDSNKHMINDVKSCRCRKDASGLVEDTRVCIFGKKSNGFFDQMAHLWQLFYLLLQQS